MKSALHTAGAEPGGRRMPRKKEGDKNRNLDAKLLVKGSDQINLHELFLTKEAELVLFFFFFLADLL